MIAKKPKPTLPDDTSRKRNAGQTASGNSRPAGFEEDCRQSEYLGRLGLGSFPIGSQLADGRLRDPPALRRFRNFYASKISNPQQTELTKAPL